MPSCLRVDGPTAALSFRIRLLADENPQVVETLLALLPMQSFLLHVVVAGETVYMPAPSVTMASKNMVERRKGTVYFNTTSQSICFCYGVVTESTKVNQFAEVCEEDLPKLVALGSAVYQQTVAEQVPRIVPVTIRLPDDLAAPETGTSQTRKISTALRTQELLDSSTCTWQAVKAMLDQRSVELRQPEEPDDIKMVRLGASTARAGGEAGVLQSMVFLQGFLSTLGPHVFARLLTLATDPDVPVGLMVRQTRLFLVDTFNHFDFLRDAGLTEMAHLGRAYDAALDTVATLDEYRLLTDAMRSLVQLQYRWVHLIFPWYLKDQFKGMDPETAAGLPKMEKYRGDS